LVCGGLVEIQTPAPIMMKFCTHTPDLSKEGFGAGLTPAPSLPGPGGKTLQAEGHIFENCLQNKRCSAVCKLTPGSAKYLS